MFESSGALGELRSTGQNTPQKIKQDAKYRGVVIGPDGGSKGREKYTSRLHVHLLVH